MDLKFCGWIACAERNPLCMPQRKRRSKTKPSHKPFSQEIVIEFSPFSSFFYEEGRYIEW